MTCSQRRASSVPYRDAEEAFFYPVAIHSRAELFCERLKDLAFKRLEPDQSLMVPQDVTAG